MSIHSPQALRPEICLESVRAVFRPERADFRLERGDSRPKRVNFRRERADFRPERASGDERMNRRLNVSPPAFYRTSKERKKERKKKERKNKANKIEEMNEKWLF